MLSIIIPTLNEEKYLPKLLESVKKNKLRNYEIIVADTDSKDDTKKIAKRFGCRITKGGNQPGIARNNGAKKAKGDLLFFMDADCTVGNQFFNKSLLEIKQKNLEVAGCFVWVPPKFKFINFQFSIYNLWIYLTQRFYPNASGHGIFCKKRIHKKIGGFDENIKLSEDMDYVKRASKFGKFRILKNVKILTSARRFEEDGSFKVGIKLLLSAIYRIFLGEIKNDIFKYKFGHKK